MAKWHIATIHVTAILTQRELPFTEENNKIVSFAFRPGGFGLRLN